MRLTAFSVPFYLLGLGLGVHRKLPLLPLQKGAQRLKKRAKLAGDIAWRHKSRCKKVLRLISFETAEITLS